MDALGWQTIAAIVTAILTAIGLLATGLRWRELALRRGEVLEWANEAIAALETLLLLCILTPAELDLGEGERRRIDVLFSTAILVERGRMFFRNQPWNDHGLTKEPAYRGLRPAILDPLVLGHQIACRLGDADEATRGKLKVISEGALKRFVSLVQMEVGRSRTASADTSKGGSGIHLGMILDTIDTSSESRNAAA